MREKTREGRGRQRSRQINARRSSELPGPYGIIQPVNQFNTPSAIVNTPLAVGEITSQQQAVTSNNMASLLQPDLWVWFITEYDISFLAPLPKIYHLA